MNKKILCTGNPNNSSVLAYAVKKVFPDAEFLYKSMGVDLTTDKGIDVFRKKITDFNVFINAAYIDVGVQETLLNITKGLWKSGHVFNIGSVAEWQSPDVNCTDSSYINSKINLRNASMASGFYNFKTTHLIVGGFKDLNDPTDCRMDPIRIAEIIKWISESEEFLIPNISVVGPPKTDLRPSTDIS